MMSFRRNGGSSDLYNLVPDPAFLVVAWDRMQVNKGARTAGVDGEAPSVLAISDAAGRMLAGQHLPVRDVEAAIDAILDGHAAVTAAGFVAVDLYDGCFLYDLTARRMRLVDLDEYRPGPFVLDTGRLPGSRRYMAPEEFVHGATIDQRTTVYTLGRTIHHLLDSPTGWRGTAAQHAVADHATHPTPADRYTDVPALARAWHLTAQP